MKSWTILVVVENHITSVIPAKAGIHDFHNFVDASRRGGTGMAYKSTLNEHEFLRTLSLSKRRNAGHFDRLSGRVEFSVRMKPRTKFPRALSLSKRN
ncbi:hypothetical protein DCC62_10895 [candidate division KSB1 bacterium]|nr:MAG: hypothetical protein DCC62_10895 [candidate division KSB1 bacterium]